MSFACAARLVGMGVMFAVLPLPNATSAMRPIQVPACSFACGTSCGTVIGPGLVIGQTWTAAGSPYCVTGDIQVDDLTIGPGVCVLVDGPFKIEVVSTLRAVGTASAPITFTARNPPGRWRGLRFTGLPPGSVLIHCRFSYSENGAVLIRNSTPAIRSCVFEENTSVFFGGALEIRMTNGDFTLEDCTIRNNASLLGGGVYAEMGSGTLRLKRCIVAGNLAKTGTWGPDSRGGGISVSGNCLMQNCLVAENFARVCLSGSGGNVNVRGGGMYVGGGSTVLDNCVLRNNGVRVDNCGAFFSQGHGFGGAIFSEGGALLIRNTIVACNTHEHFLGSIGSAIYALGGTVDIVNSTLARNPTAVVGSSSSSAVTVTVRNSIVRKNLYGIGGTINYSDVDGAPAGVGNINQDPVFTGTGCDACDLAIAATSPCVDAGDPSVAFNDAQPPGLGTPRNDMGAHGGPKGVAWVDANALGGALEYCTANANSTGMPARIGACGSTSIAANDLVLSATTCPAFRAGFFFYGCAADQTPIANGWLCIAGPLFRLPVVITDGTGTASFQLDHASLPSGGAVTPGDARRFQLWFRDSAAAGALSNLTNGLEVFFRP